MGRFRADSLPRRGAVLRLSSDRNRRRQHQPTGREAAPGGPGDRATGGSPLPRALAGRCRPGRDRSEPGPRTPRRRGRPGARRAAGGAAAGARRHSPAPPPARRRGRAPGPLPRFRPGRNCGISPPTTAWERIRAKPQGSSRNGCLPRECSAARTKWTRRDGRPRHPCGRTSKARSTAARPPDPAGARAMPAGPARRAGSL